MPKPYSDTPEQRELVALENRVKFLEAQYQQLEKRMTDMETDGHSNPS